ncbi:probable amidase At4g34880 [Macadamia integrifolia]|uniref:probable amidase At4g34880 n=1 Tax=Macadamia integrifolia TaxID=60698 RepID=UPI001C4FE35C|nr:probable amidase At4g34880 [Macadamia integrifolia]XP_042514949.1 probable amidase At4g34880 [Macadamia integrifolia]
MVFNFEEATIEEIQLAFSQNSLTSKELVQYYLNAIEKWNPTLHAVIEVNPDAVALAEAEHSTRRSQIRCFCEEKPDPPDPPVPPVPSVRGIPVLLKDNIATKDRMETTSGSLALLGSVVPRDAGVVDRLRDAGAIILGKAGLTEWANGRSTMMQPGWSARGGTVQNPYQVDAFQGGSSTGSAVSVAANLVTVSLGTETDQSIIQPCSLNGVVGIKPTVGLTSRSGVVPLSLRQDTVGPIARTVSDAVHVLDVIVGYDPRDEITLDAAQYNPTDKYRKFLRIDGLNGKRIANLWHHFTIIYDSDSDSSVPGIFQSILETMREKGAVVLDGLVVPDFDTIVMPNESGQSVALKYELKRDLNAYFSNLLESPVRSLADVIAFNEKHPVEEKLEEYKQDFFEASQETNLPSNAYTEAIQKLENLVKGFEKFMMDNNLDAFVAPEYAGGAILAIGGHPGITVPAGFDNREIPAGSDPKGVPIGILFGGLKGSEGRLIEIAYAFEQATKKREPPIIAS